MDEGAEQNSGAVVIVADHREIPSTVTRHLIDLQAQVREQQLAVGDYVCSDRVCVERKRVSDFLSSIMDQRLFEQMQSLKDSYEKPLLIIEGNPEMLFLERNMHGNTIRGVLASLAIDYHIPLMWTSNAKETAAQIYWIAYREQVKQQRTVQVRAMKKVSTLGRQQEYLVAGLPTVNSVLSRRLLKKFKTIRKVFTAKEEKLMKVEGLGPIKAKKIAELLNAKYEEEEQ